MINNFLGMAIQIVEGFKSKRHVNECYNNRSYLGLLSNRYLIVRIPDSRISKLLCQSLFIGLFILSFPLLGSSFGGSLIDVNDREFGTDHRDPMINFEHLPLLFRDLKNEGILKTGDRALFVASNGGENAVYGSQILSDNDMELVSANDFDRQNAMSKDSFDFIFTHSYSSTADFIERTLKPGGVAVIDQTNQNPSSSFDKPLNYKIVYLRQFDVTVLAMRKTNNAEPVYSGTHRRLLNSKEAKKAALNKLEDVLLEPPRASSRRSSKYLKKTKYLPDLMGDSLESYPRRVFIDVGLPGSGTGWFAKNYPTRNRDFEIYKIETVTEESSGKEVPQVAEIGMSNWLRNNVKEEDYVVMKAEAEVVEEMTKSTAIELVDELFLECKPKGNGRRMAYWQCLALYGKLRDEGVAVHQWWG